MFSAKPLQEKPANPRSSGCELRAHRQTRFPSLVNCTGSKNAALVPRAVWEGMDPDLVQIWRVIGDSTGLQKGTEMVRKSHQREPGFHQVLLRAATNCCARCNQLHRLRACRGAGQSIALACPSRTCPHFTHSLHLALLFSPHSKTFQEATSAPQVMLGRAFQDLLWQRAAAIAACLHCWNGTSLSSIFIKAKKSPNDSCVWSPMLAYSVT